MKRLASTKSPAGGRGSANGTAFVAMGLSLPDEGEDRQGRRLEMGRMPGPAGHRLSAPLIFPGRSEERRDGQGWVGQGRYRCSPINIKQISVHDYMSRQT